MSLYNIGIGADLPDLSHGQKAVLERARGRRNVAAVRTTLTKEIRHRGGTIVAVAAVLTLVGGVGMGLALRGRRKRAV
jgi:hypothetical protein